MKMKKMKKKKRKRKIFQTLINRKVMNKMKKMILIAVTKTTLKQARVNLTLIRILRKEENSLL